MFWWVYLARNPETLGIPIKKNIGMPPSYEIQQPFGVDFDWKEAIRIPPSLRLASIAVENGPFIDDLPMKIVISIANCVLTREYHPFDMGVSENGGSPKLPKLI